MINVGDTVKVINSTEFQGNQICFYPIGTICNVIEKDVDGALGILPIGTYKHYPHYYWENELEKSHTEWVKD